MQSKDQGYRQSLQHFLDDSISPAEKDALMSAVADGHADADLGSALDAAWADTAEGSLAGAPGMTGVQKGVLFEQISGQIAEEKQREQAANIRHAVPLWRRYRWLAAAAVTGVLLAAGWLLMRPGAEQPGIAMQVPGHFRHISNTAGGLTRVTLPDQSVVTLTEGATVYYPAQFDAESREVYLSGDAFFEVARLNGEKFRVHSLNLVTEVLGTSFWIRESSSTGTSKVEVRSGKVRVSAKQHLHSSGQDGSSVVVLPNQQAVYQTGTSRIDVMLADTLVPLTAHDASPVPAVSLNITKPMPLSSIFLQLEKMYGVDIEVASESLLHCLMAGDLSSQDLLKKLEIICLSVGASYRVQGTHIVITGEGCGH